LGLLLTFLISKLDASKQTVRRVLQNITIDYLGKEMNLMNYLKSKIWVQNVLSSCNRFEVMSYAFAMMFVLQDVELLQVMAKQSNQFTYQFDNKEEFVVSGALKGKLKLTILYLDFLGYMVVDHEKKSHYMLTNCQFPYIAKVMYEISLSMCGLTSKKIIETSLGKTDLTKFVKEQKWTRKGLILKQISKNRFRYCDGRNEIVKAIPVFYRDKIGKNIPDHRGSMQ